MKQVVVCAGTMPVVAHTMTAQTRKERSPVAKQSFGMYNILIYIPYSFQIMHDEERNKKEERKKERRITKKEFLL